jgi:hydroxyacylglutathione hydrolase
MKQVSEGVWFIQGQDEFIPDSHVYVLGKASSHDLTLVDAGLMGKGRYKIRSIQEGGIPLSDIKRIIMTHTHLDHIGCLPELLREFPEAEVWMHRSEGELLENGDDRAVYGMEMFRTMCQSQYGLSDGAFRITVHRKLEGGETLSLGQTTWEVVHIPGHSVGGIALYSREARILIPGDVVYADHAIGRYDLYGASGPDLKRSLSALADLDVNILLPGHNRIVEGLPPGYISQTAAQWAPYLG